MIFVYNHKMTNNQCNIVNKIFRDYFKKYAPEVMSMGFIGLGQDGSMVYKSAIGDILPLEPGFDTTFAHLRVPFLKKKYTISEENIQPFILENRYIVMHNGYVNIKTSTQKSDSRLLFEEWRTGAKPDQGIYESFIPIINKYKRALLNVIIYDTQTEEILAYHGR